MLPLASSVELATGTFLLLTLVGGVAFGVVLPVVDARAQMQSALGASAGAGGGMLAAVSALAEAVAQAPAARIESLSFRGNVLEVNLRVPNVESLEAIRQGMNRDGLVAEIQSATQRADAHAGRLHVRLGPA